MPDLTPYAPTTPQKDPSTGILNLAAPFVGDAVNGLVSLFTAKRNRQNALDDWNRQNEYNSPAAQMQRYKDAGLNPHLIYGQSNTSQPVRSTDMVAPQLDPKNLDMITRHQNINQQKLATDNLQKQLEVQDANIKLIEANTLKANSETNWKNVNTDRLANNIMPYDFDYYNQRSQNMAQARTNMVGQNDRQWQQLQPTINKIVSDTGLNTQRKALMLSTIDRLKELLRGDKITNTQKQLIGDLTQQSLLQDQGLKRDRLSIDQRRLQLAEAGFNQMQISSIISLFSKL